MIKTILIKLLDIDEQLIQNNSKKSYKYLIFKAHPHTVGETYFTHAGVALKASGYSLISSLFLLIHAIFPITFTHTGTNLNNKTKNILDRTDKNNYYNLPKNIIPVDQEV